MTDTTDLHPAFTRYHGTRQRIKVETIYRDEHGTVTTTHVRCGHVGITTGTRPAYLLMARSNSIGSADLLTPDTDTHETRVIAIADNTGHYHRQHPMPAPVLSDRIGYHHPTTNQDNTTQQLAQPRDTD